MHEPQPTLPGLDLSFDTDGAPKLVQAVERTLRAYDDAGLLTPMHAAPAQLAIDLAWTVARAGGRASAAAMASAQLMACLATLPRPVDATEGDKLDVLLAQLAAAES